MNTTPIGITDDYETWTNEEWMIPYLFILLIIGTIGNIFGIFVFINSSMRKYSCTLYFLLMSIFDELTLFVWVANRLSDELTHTQLRNRSTILCKLYTVVYYSSSQASIGMLVLATFDRLYTTFKMFHGCFDVRLLTRRRRFQYTCLCIFFLIMIGFNAILFGSQLESRLEESDEKPCLIIDREITRIYSIIDLCIYAIIPCIGMVIGDILILYYIQKTRARVISINNINRRRERQLSIMLVITTIVSLIIVSPYSVFNLVVNFSNVLEDDDDNRILFILYEIFGLLSISTHAMHFYLFLINSDTIRKHFRIVLKSFITTCLNTRNIIRPAAIPTIRTTTSSQLPVKIIQQTPYLQTIK